MVNLDLQFSAINEQQKVKNETAEKQTDEVDRRRKTKTENFI